MIQSERRYTSAFDGSRENISRPVRALSSATPPQAGGPDAFRLPIRQSYV